jgi:hypothetical protein
MSAPDHIYLDLFTLNSDNKGTGVKTALNFTETRTTNIIDNPANYFMSVVRFQADTPSVSLPIFIPTILCDGLNANPNKTIYTIMMLGIGNVVFAENVMWVPEDQTAFPPNNKYDPITGALIQVDYSTGYYNGYSARWWLACVNKTLRRVWNRMYSGGGENTPLTSPPTYGSPADNAYSPNAPYMTIDPLTNLITLMTPYQNSNGVNLNFALESKSILSLDIVSTYNNNINALYFNEPMMNLFSGFTSQYYGDAFRNQPFPPSYITSIAGRSFLFNYNISPFIFGGGSIITIDGNQWVATNSEYSPVPMWNPIASLVFTSSLLPINFSLTSVPNVYNNDPKDLSHPNTTNNSQVSNMLSDIQIGLVSGSEYKPSVLYVPSGEYRLIDLLGNNPVFQASFGISWKSKYGDLIPFKLGAQCGANIKIMFRRKRFNLGNLEPYDTN